MQTCFTLRLNGKPKPGKLPLHILFGGNKNKNEKRTRNKINLNATHKLEMHTIAQILYLEPFTVGVAVLFLADDFFCGCLLSNVLRSFEAVAQRFLARRSLARPATATPAATPAATQLAAVSVSVRISQISGLHAAEYLCERTYVVSVRAICRCIGVPFMRNSPAAPHGAVVVLVRHTHVRRNFPAALTQPHLGFNLFGTFCGMPVNWPTIEFGIFRTVSLTKCPSHVLAARRVCFCFASVLLPLQTVADFSKKGSFFRRPRSFRWVRSVYNPAHAPRHYGLYGYSIHLWGTFGPSRLEAVAVVAINDHLNYICARKVYKNSLPSRAGSDCSSWRLCPKKSTRKNTRHHSDSGPGGLFLIFPIHFGRRQQKFLRLFCTMRKYNDNGPSDPRPPTPTVPPPHLGIPLWLELGIGAGDFIVGFLI